MRKEEQMLKALCLVAPPLVPGSRNPHELTDSAAGMGMLVLSCLFVLILVLLIIIGSRNPSEEH